MAETQQLPSWMTLSTTVYTNAAGQTVTSETTLQLPLTYYGPSIPLGDDGAWTYGGVSSPATSFVPTSTAISSSPTSSAIPSSSLSSYQSTSASSTSSYISSSTSSSTSSAASATSSPHSNSDSLSKGALIGIILGAIALFIILLLLFIWLVRWNSRRRDSRAITPIWTGWNVLTRIPTVDEENRTPGAGSPRNSGEEAHPFLRQSSRLSQSSRPLSPLPPGAARPHIIGSTGSDRTRSSQASTDYGVVVPGSGRFGHAYHDEGLIARVSSERVGHIMPPAELLRIEDEEEPEEMPPPRMYSASHPSLPEHIAPLTPPPPCEPIRNPSLLDEKEKEKEKSVRRSSYPVSEMEVSKVFTARRVRVQELSQHTQEDDDFMLNVPPPAPSSWRNSFSRLRKSWFGSTSTRSASRLSYQDAEAGQSLLSHKLRVGLNSVGERPMSTVSTKSAVSGNTVYHDATSRMGTPVSLPSRAVTPATPRGCITPAIDFAPPIPSGAPPTYDDSIGSKNNIPYPVGVDVLDMPAPAPFSTASSRAPLPPGLIPLSSHRAWRDSLSVITGSSNDACVTVDALDAEPPRAGDGWRNLAGGLLGGGAGPDPNERRTTFGVPQVIHQRNPMISEQGSLHSMQSHLSPYPSSGSAPTSSGRAFNLSGSNSSRPSARSAQSRIATASSASLTSSRRPGPTSPAVSAVGHADRVQYMSYGSEEFEDANSEPGRRTSILGPMPSFTARSILSQPTIRSVGNTTFTSDETEVTGTTYASGVEDDMLTNATSSWFQEPISPDF